MLAALLLSVWTGSSKAAIPSGGTLNATTTSVSWQGQYYAAGAVADPTLCPPGAVDPANLICDHFELTVQTAGSVTVTVSWPSPNCASNPTNPTPGVPCDTEGNDFDLYVFDSNNMEVAASATPQPPGNSETVTFAATAQTYEVRVVPFSVINSDYEGTASLTPSGGGTAGGGGGGIDPPISIASSSVAEGDSGLTGMPFQVTMGWPTSVPVTVNYQTFDAWASGTATPAVDYTPSAGTVVFQPGETQKTIYIPVIGDTNQEPDETFLVTLALPDPALLVARIQDGQAVGTILNDDWAHWVSGKGTVGLPLGAQGRFTLRANEHLRGKLSYRGAAIVFGATSISSYTYDDLAHSVTIQGSGWNAGHTVTYVLQATDNGPTGTLDTFTLTLSDGARASGTLTSGDIAYHSG